MSLPELPPLSDVCVQCGRPFRPGDRFVIVPPKRPAPDGEPMRLRVHPECRGRWERGEKS